MKPSNSALNWQPNLNGDGIVTDIDDVNQCIQTILSTPVGSEVLRPDFGSNIWQYIDWPIDRARPHIVREAMNALTKFEPRISVTAITVNEAADYGHAYLLVSWNAANQNGKTTVTL